MMDKPYQRKGSTSNAQVGQTFEDLVKRYFQSQGVFLTSPFSLLIGINSTKMHKFDLGNSQQKILVECKSHCWTEGNNIPSAKITTWDQAMFYFYISPPDFKKILFVLHSYSKSRNETLADYYIRLNSHLIPSDVEIWEYDEEKGNVNKLLIR
jgi:hypothetical protein